MSFPPYAELHCITNYTFLRGASHPEELVKAAHALGYTALAITDECSLAGIVRAHVAAERCGFQLLIGSEFRVAHVGKLVVLAKSRYGYKTLCHTITKARRKVPKGSYSTSLKQLTSDLRECFVLWIPERFSQTLETGYQLKGCFGAQLRIAIELMRDGTDGEKLDALTATGEKLGISCVAAGGVYMHTVERRRLADVVTAIRLKKAFPEAAIHCHSNGEGHLRSKSELCSIYPSRLLEASVSLAQQCNFSLRELKYRYPNEVIPKGETPISWLRKLAFHGAQKRWPKGIPTVIAQQMESELSLIEELGYEDFFITVEDIVSFARKNGILCQGRGSAANSSVCYALGITEVDPERMQMLFERFISRERGEPPDIDVDFESGRREEVIQYIYNKYGRHRAALVSSVSTYRLKSAVRDIGKALGIDHGTIERVTRNLYWMEGGEQISKRLIGCGIDPKGPQARLWNDLANELLGFPRHLSQHVGGFLISRDEISDLCPIEPAAMADRSVIQWDKDDIDALGFIKVDILALGMLSALSCAFRLVSQIRGKPFSISDIPDHDQQTYSMIQRADTIGVFQIESRAQMAMLPRLKPASFYDLVIEIALVRPGPIQGDMVHPYLRRRQGLESIVYPNPELEKVLGRTLGVPIFQEQVMRLAIVAAGFTPGEADELRRSMAAWSRHGNLDFFRNRLLTGMAGQGYSRKFAQTLYHQISGFGEYGFPESHAASFALIVYASAWLKCHEPEAFACALLNSQPMGFYAPAQIIADVRRHRVTVNPVDVMSSCWDSQLELQETERPALRLGLKLIKGLSETSAKRLVHARDERPFDDLWDLQQRSKIPRDELAALASSGALSSLSGHRHRSLWATQGLDAGNFLLDNSPFIEAIPLLRKPSKGQDLVADYASLGLTLGPHPVSLIRDKVVDPLTTNSEGLKAQAAGNQVKVLGMVINRQRPETASGVIFMTLEDEKGWINLVVWPSVVQRERTAILQGKILLVSGRVQRTEQLVHLVVEHAEDWSNLLQNVNLQSRNFK